MANNSGMPAVTKGNRQLKILILDDDPEELELLRLQFTRLKGFDVKLSAFDDIDEARRAIRDGDFDAHFLDLRLGRLSGIDVMLEALARDAGKLFVIVTGMGDEAIAANSIKLGAIGYVSKGGLGAGKLEGVLHGLILESANRAERVRKLHESLFDPLSSVHNNASFRSVGAHLIVSNITCTEYWGVVYLDVDGQGLINEDLGRLEGDENLRQVAAVVRETVGPGDLVGRVDNDEFCVLSCVGGQADALRLARRLCDAVDSQTSASVSVGVACERADDTNLEELITEAELAMRRARKAGGNCVKSIEEE